MPKAKHNRRPSKKQNKILQKIKEAAKESILQYNLQDPSSTNSNSNATVLQSTTSQRDNNALTPFQQSNNLNKNPSINEETSRLHTSHENLIIAAAQEVLNEMASSTKKHEKSQKTPNNLNETPHQVSKKKVLTHSETESSLSNNTTSKQKEDGVFGNKLRRSYTDFMADNNFVVSNFNQFKESWPKYVGSLIIKEKFSQNSQHELSKICIGTPIQIEYSDVSGRFYKPHKFFDVPSKWSYKLRPFIHNTIIFHKAGEKNYKAVMNHKYNEMWAFLDKFHYIMITGEVVENDYLCQFGDVLEEDMYYACLSKYNKPQYIYIKLNVFLRDEFIINPINLALKKHGVTGNRVTFNRYGDVSQLNHELEEQKIENKEIGRICKEALVILFEFLQVFHNFFVLFVFFNIFILIFQIIGQKDNSKSHSITQENNLIRCLKNKEIWCQ